MDLVKINASEYGLEENKAKEIEAQFKPMLDKMIELETEYNEILTLEINEETCVKAKNLRLRYVKVRTGTDTIHKAQKAFYLSGGRFCDGWKNAQLFASQGCESTLMSIEKHYENIEYERLNTLQLERVELLSKYVEDAHERELSGMDDDVWNAYIKTKEQDFKDKLAAEKKAELERIEAEKAKIAEDKRIRAENERLEKEAKQKEKEALLRTERNKKRESELKPYMVFIRCYANLLDANESGYQKQFADIKKGAELQWESDRKEAKEKAAQEEKDRIAREKLKEQLEEKEEAERIENQRLLDERQKQIKAGKDALLAPDKDKLLKFADTIEGLIFPQLKSNEAAEILKNIVNLLDKTTGYIKEKANSL